MKKEDKLQHHVVMWFSQTFPNLYGCMWAVFNEDSKHKKALGMHSGASDLQFLINGTFIGIEIKAAKSVHKASHIKRQIEWGENIIKNGGHYYIGSSFEEITDIIFCAVANTKMLNFDSINKAKEQFNKATIKF